MSGYGMNKIMSAGPCLCTYTSLTGQVGQRASEALQGSKALSGLPHWCYKENREVALVGGVAAGRFRKDGGDGVAQNEEIDQICKRRGGRFTCIGAQPNLYYHWTINEHFDEVEILLA